MVKNDEYTPMIIDIKMVLDTAPFWQRHPDLSQNLHTPTEIEPEEAFMVAVPKQNVCKHASDKLELAARKGDVLRWHVSHTARDLLYVILCKIMADSIDSQLTTIPKIAVTSRSFPVPNTADPTRYAESQHVDTYFHCKVNGYGKQYYTLLFYIVERNNVDGSLDTVGYFSWKSMLVIREPQSF